MEKVKRRQKIMAQFKLLVKSFVGVIKFSDVQNHDITYKLNFPDRVHEWTVEVTCWNNDKYRAGMSLPLYIVPAYQVKIVTAYFNELFMDTFRKAENRMYIKEADNVPQKDS